VRTEPPFDLALVDLQLPDMNGLELAQALHAIDPNLRLLAVTAQVSADTRDDCLAHGMCGVVTKPFTPARLFAEVSRSLPATHSDPAAAVIPVAMAAEDSPSAGDPRVGSGCASPDPAAALHALFPGEPARVQRVLSTLAAEFTQHETDFAAAAAQADLTALRALRHKLHSALIQLHLDRLRQALDALIESPASFVHRETAAAALREAAHALRETMSPPSAARDTESAVAVTSTAPH
jgi:two-component system, sensor histidine kinase and response regulator